MKRLTLFFSLGLVCILASAVPAKRVTKTITLTDGSRIEAMLRGDEHGHFFVGTDGVAYTEAGENIYAKADLQQIQARRQARMKVANQRRALRHEKHRATWGADTNPISGQKKGLVILVNFSDVKMTYTRQNYDKFFNQVGYSDYGMAGSVHDYFYAQSYGKFDLTFDVVGPVTVSKDMAYYGKNENDEDMYPGTMVAEACKLVNSQVNYKDYDWDDDGEVDQVYVIYAGYAEAFGAPANTIWPHEYSLSDASYYGDGDGALTLDGVRIDTYACSNELSGVSGTDINGIGTACHEFSHCMALPDFYDTDYKSFGMGDWDLLDGGSYNGEGYNGECPAGYTSYERMYCGWLTPVELFEAGFVKKMRPITDEPEAYIIYNRNNTNEYYMLENRQLQGFDSCLPNHGMLILHVTFSSSAWTNNTVNTTSMQRMTIIPADGTLKMVAYQGSYYADSKDMLGDVWPGTSGNTELTDTSKPAATLNMANVDGRKFMGKPITDITEEDGLISFTFDGGVFVETPVALDATNVTEDGFTARWKAVTGISKYQLSLTSRSASASTEGELLLQEDFSKFNTGKEGTNDLKDKLDDYTSTPGWSGYKVFPTAENAVKMGNSKEGGKLGTPEFEAPMCGGVTVKFTCRNYNNDAGKMNVLVNGDVAGSVSLSSEYDEYEVSAPCEKAFSVSLETTKRVYLSNVEIYDMPYVPATSLHAASKPTILDVEGTQYIFSGLDNQQIYSYSVRSVVDEYTSSWSNVISVALKGGDGIFDVLNRMEAQPAVFDIQGVRRESAPRQKGLYIIDGRKVLVR